MKTIKGLSKAIYIIAKIGKIFVTIGLVCIILGMIAVGLVIKITNVSRDGISFEGSKEAITFVENEDDENYLDIKLDDKVLVGKISKVEVEKVIIAFESNDKTVLVVCLELGMLAGFISLLLTRMILRRLEKIFKGISKSDTPFIEEGAKYFKQIGKLMIWLVVLSCFGAGAYSYLDNMNYSFTFNGYSVIEILIAFVLSYIFKYGYEMQNGKAIEGKVVEVKAEEKEELVEEDKEEK